MKRMGMYAVATGLFFADAGGAAAQGLVIDHKVVGCVVAEKFAKIEARFDPAESVARPRVYFRAKGTPHWYFVEMKAEGGAFYGVLPKPKKSLGALDYYVEVLDRAFVASRTPEYQPAVVAPPGACGKGLPMAAALSAAKPIVGAAPGAPALPPGFSASGVLPAGSAAATAGATAGTAGAAAATGAAAGGLSSGAIAAIAVGGAAAVAGGVVVATHSSSSPTTTLPPSVTGTWTGTAVNTRTGVLAADNCSAETDSLTLSFTQSGSSLSGTRRIVVVSPGLCADGSSSGAVGSTSGDQPISGTVSPPSITFGGPCGGGAGVLTWVGTISGNSMAGTTECSYSAGRETQGKITGTWNVSKQ